MSAIVDYRPLPHEWMLASILGFLVSAFAIYPDFSHTWGATFAVFFIIIFIASLLSMGSQSLDEDDLSELAVHEEHVRAGRHRTKI